MLELNKIYNEDCLIGMKKIDDESIDMILCDLPYGTTNCNWDVIIPFEPLWEQYKRVIKPNGAIVLTASQPFTSKLIMSNLGMFKYEVIWQKDNATNFLNANRQIGKIHENAIVFYDKQPVYNPQMREGKAYVAKGKHRSPAQPTSVITSPLLRVDTINTGGRYPVSIVKFNSERGLHPTQKPVALFEYLIKTYTNEGETVLDNCMGSGTTAVACINTNRNFIGFELDKEYFDKANNRIKNLDKRLFV